MDDGHGLGERLGGGRATGGVHPEGPSLEGHHQPWYLRGSGKGEVTLLEIHLAVLPRPRVDRSKPDLVHTADVGRGEAVILVVDRSQLFKGADLFTSLDAVHLALELDPQQVLENTPTRARLKLSFRQSRDVIPIARFQSNNPFGEVARTC